MDSEGMTYIDTSDVPESLTPEQEAILDERIRKWESGITHVSSWDEVKLRITAKRPFQIQP